MMGIYVLRRLETIYDVFISQRLYDEIQFDIKLLDDHISAEILVQRKL